MDEDQGSSAPHISLPEFLFVAITLGIVDCINWIPVVGSVVGFVVGPSLTLYTFFRGLPKSSPIISAIASLGEEVPAIQALPLYSVSWLIVYFMTNNARASALIAAGGATAPFALAKKLGVPGADKAVGVMRAGTKAAGGAGGAAGAATGAKGAAQTAGGEARAASTAVERRPSRQTSSFGQANDNASLQDAGEAPSPQRARVEYAKEFAEEHDVMKRSAAQLFKTPAAANDNDEDVTVRPDGTVDLSGS